MHEQQLLKGVLFDRLPADIVEKLSRACIWRYYPAHTSVIFDQDVDNEVLFIQSGRVRATTVTAAGKLVIFREIESGNVAGDLAAIDGQPRSANIETVEPSLLAIMPGRRFLRFLEEYPAFMQQEMRSLSAQIRHQSDLIYEMATQKVDVRVQLYLLRQARKKQLSSGQLSVADLPAHADIAAELGTRREAISREISHLKRTGVISDGKTEGLIDLIGLEKMLGIR